MSTRDYRIVGVPLSALSALSAPSRAAAEVGGHVAADFDLGTASSEGALTVGGGGRFGWRFNVGPLWLQPEAGAHHTALTTVGCFYCVHTTHITRITGGVRLGGSGLVSGVVEPALFVHGGYGWLRGGGPGNRDDDIGAPYDPSLATRGPAFDVGFALDVKVVRYFRFGVQGAYNILQPTYPDSYSGPVVLGAARWVSFGLHVGVAL